MNARIVVSICALLASAYGITPAAAESFNDRSWDWTMASPMPATAASTRQSLPADGSFAYSWGSGATPSQYRGGPAASSTDRATGQRCEAPPRVGFNQRNAFPTC